MLRRMQLGDVACHLFRTGSELGGEQIDTLPHGDEAAARGAGMNAYLRKPLSPSGLSEAIAAVIPPPA